MAGTTYHSVLRVSAFVCAFTLLFDSGLVLPITKELSNNAMQYVASSAVGVFAGVAPNEINTITAQLSERERELNAREAELTEREIAARTYGNGVVREDYSSFILSVILFILTSLIVMNYVMDWNRMRILIHAR